MFAFFVHLLLRRSRALFSSSSSDDGGVFPSRPLFFLESLSLLAAAATISFARIYLGYHTVEQVAVGAALGALAAVATRAVVLADAGGIGGGGGKKKKKKITSNKRR